MRNDHYPRGSVLALLSTDLVTPATRQVLQERLQKPFVIAPRFFNEDQITTLRAVCNCLIPQPDLARVVDLAGGLDSRIADGRGNGWRYNSLPADEEMFARGIGGIDETSGLMFNEPFYLLAVSQQEEVLNSIQSGEATGNNWKTISSELFFEELLAAIVELFYSHPFGKEEIGEVAMADAKGWQKVGLNELEAHEPKLLKDQSDAGE